MKKLRTFKEVINDPSVNNALKNTVQSMVNKMIVPNAPFSGMLTYFDTLFVI